MVARILILALFAFGAISSVRAQILPFTYWKSGLTCAAGGYAYSGNCYYLGAAGDNCFTTCNNTGVGGCLQAATKTVANSSSVCKSTLQAMGKSPSGFAGGTNTYAYACSINGTTYTYDTGSITCGATAASNQRVCACGAGGTTQAGVATVDGYNYRLGASGDSCDTTCASYGGCNLAGVQNAASSGTKCDQLITAVDLATSGGSSGSTAVGCGYQPPGTYASRYLGSLTATCAATLSGTQRICACNNP